MPLKASPKGRALKAGPWQLLGHARRRPAAASVMPNSRGSCDRELASVGEARLLLLRAAKGKRKLRHQIIESLRNHRPSRQWLSGCWLECALAPALDVARTVRWPIPLETFTTSTPPAHVAFRQCSPPAVVADKAPHRARGCDLANPGVDSPLRRTCAAPQTKRLPSCASCHCLVPALKHSDGSRQKKRPTRPRPAERETDHADGGQRAG